MGTPHVLVVSDRVDRCAFITRALRELDARATLVAPGMAAVVAARQLSPDVAAVDGDHVEGCRTVLLLGRLPVLRRTLVLTDTPTGDRIDRCLIAGAADVVAWHEPAEQLAGVIIDRVQGLPPERAEAVRQRRRHALARLAATEAGRPPNVTVQITALERVGRARSATDGERLVDTLGPAQRRVLNGLRAGMSYVEIAHAAGVTLSAVYRAKQRLARRLGVPFELLAETVAQDRPLVDRAEASS